MTGIQVPGPLVRITSGFTDAMRSMLDNMIDGIRMTAVTTDSPTARILPIALTCIGIGKSAPRMDPIRAALVVSDVATTITNDRILDFFADRDLTSLSISEV